MGKSYSGYKNRGFFLACLVALVSFFGMMVASGTSLATTPQIVGWVEWSETQRSNLQISFIANNGQVDERVKICWVSCLNPIYITEFRLSGSKQGFYCNPVPSLELGNERESKIY